MTKNTRPTNTTEAVLAALAGRPEATAAEVADAAGIGQSTAAKALAALAAEDKVHRAAGGRDRGRRLPDRWSLAAPPKPVRNGQRPNGAAAEAARLGKGQLGELVLAHLRGHPGEHSPTAVAHALGGRSTGAVGNALDRLVRSGSAVQVTDHPKTYLPATPPRRRGPRR